MLFPTSSKTSNSLAGIGVGLIALEWPDKGQEQALFVVLSMCQWYSQTKFPSSTFATLAISALSEIIRPWQTYLSLVFPLKQHIFATSNFPSENAKANSNATINTNFMPDFEQKIQHCYHNQFFVEKDIGEKNFHRSCLERINLSWFVTTLSSAKAKHLPGILNCRHFDAVCFYGNIGCLPFGGKIRKFRFEVKW